MEMRQEDKRIDNFANFINNIWDAQTFNYYVDCLQNIQQPARMPCVDYYKYLSVKPSEPKIVNSDVEWIDVKRA